MSSNERAQTQKKILRIKRNGWIKKTAGKKSNVTHWIWIEVEHIDGNVGRKKNLNEQNIRSEELNRHLLVDYNVRLLKCNFRILDVNDVMTTSRHNLAVVAAITITTRATAAIEWEREREIEWASELSNCSFNPCIKFGRSIVCLDHNCCAVNEWIVYCCCYTFWLFAKIDV